MRMPWNILQHTRNREIKSLVGILPIIATHSWINIYRFPHRVFFAEVFHRHFPGKHNGTRLI